MSNTQPFLSIILPVYNDAQALQKFLPKVLAFAETLPEQQQIIIVDDGSKDNIKQVFATMLNTCSSNVQMQLIKLSRNFGKESALSAGLAHAEGKYIAMLDSDGQHPLSVLEQMLVMMLQSEESGQSSIDMIAGIQANRPHESRLAKTLKRSFYLFIQDSRRYEIRPNAGDFRLMNQKVLKALMSLPERQRFMKGLYAWVGFQAIYLPFTADNRDTGESKFNFSSLFELALVGITSFSQRPLRLILRMGFLVSLLAILYGCYIVFETLFYGNDVAGWTTVAAGIMFSTGIQLICIGVIGEYVGRLYEEVKQRPIYLIDEILDQNSMLSCGNDASDENLTTEPKNDLNNNITDQEFTTTAHTRGNENKDSKKCEDKKSNDIVLNNDASINNNYLSQKANNTIHNTADNSLDNRDNS